MTKKDGSFSLDGLRAGNYRLLAQMKNSAANLLGEVNIEADKTLSVIRQIKTSKTAFEIDRIGFNAQLSTIAVPLNPGKAYQLFVSGKNLDQAETAAVFINSPFFKVTPNSFRQEDFDAENPVTSFEIQIAPNAPTGEYSICLQPSNGETGCFIGALTIDNVTNDFQSHLFLTRFDARRKREFVIAAHKS